MLAIPDFSERPMVVVWEVTRSCALACKHCRAEARPYRHPNELRRDEISRLLDQVAEIQPRYFILTGGDPAMRPDLLDIIADATRRGLSVAVSPSATPRLLKADFRAWRQAGVSCMSLSLDGANPTSHDAFRGVQGAWDWTMEAANSARKAGIQLQINTTFTNENIGELDEFFHLIPRLMPKVWSLFLLVPTGRANASQMLCGDEMESLFKRLLEFSERSEISIKTTEGPHFRRVVHQSRYGSGKSTTRQHAPTNDGRGFVFVSHIGEIQPSGFLPIACGNVKCHNLGSVYRHSPVFRALRDADRLKGKCGNCEYRKICGGSRARAYAMTGDYLAQEPSCSYVPQKLRTSRKSHL